MTITDSGVVPDPHVSDRKHCDAAFQIHAPSNPRRFLRVRGIIRSASRAENREIMDLAVLGMHQDDTAFAASKIVRVMARVENWRGTDKAVMPWSGNGLEADLNARGHGVLQWA